MKIKNTTMLLGYNSYKNMISPVILFAFINGGGTIISTLVAAIVYKEKLSKRTCPGIVIGIASLLIIKMFEYS